MDKEHQSTVWIRRLTIRFLFILWVNGTSTPIGRLFAIAALIAARAAKGFYIRLARYCLNDTPHHKELVTQANTFLELALLLNT